MARSVISEGNTTNEAIEKGLKELNVSKDMVDIKFIEEKEKRSFFSILTPRVVKVELTLKEEKLENKNIQQHKEIQENKREIEVTLEDLNIAKENLEIFLKNNINKIAQGATFEIRETENNIEVNINGENIGFLIGYRGECLYAFQTILSAIGNKNVKNRVRVILDIQGYKQKRVKALEELAEKVAKTVIRTGKSITLEPMQAYERKIIHSKLQNHNKIITKSIGNEPKRKIVISLNK